jgi:hypothetical protein
MIDIKIMAHPKRKENIRIILDSLGLDESIVCWDDRPNGGDAWYTARKAWSSPLPKGCTHRLVLQDDVKLCENFVKHATAIADRHPTHAVTLINFLSPRNYPNHRNTPYYKLDGNMAGCAIMLPVGVIEDMVKWCDESTDEILKPHDDLMISKYCKEHNILIVATIPSIVQHIGEQSLFATVYNWDRMSKNFTEKPNADWTIHSVQKVL